MQTMKMYVLNKIVKIHYIQTMKMCVLNKIVKNKA